jgi:hypothetical protein
MTITRYKQLGEVIKTRFSYLPFSKNQKTYIKTKKEEKRVIMFVLSVE